MKVRTFPVTMKSSYKLMLVPKRLLWWNTFILADRLETIQTILDLPQKLITVSWLAASNLSTTSHWKASRFCELTNNKRRAGKWSGATKSSCTDGSRLRHPRPRRSGPKIQRRFSPPRTPSWGFFGLQNWIFSKVCCFNHRNAHFR